MAMAVSNQQSRDAALLRATTEMFVLETTHDRDEIHRFEELATHFLAKVGAADRGFVAERLSKSLDAPGSILRMLGKDLAEIAAPILKRSPALGEFDMLTIMASTGPAHHRLLASRQDLSPTIVLALRRTGDPEVIERLAGYPAVTVDPPRRADAPKPSARREDPPAQAAPAPLLEARPMLEAKPAPEAKPHIEPEDRRPILPRPAGLKAEAFEVFAATRAMTAALGREISTLTFDPPASKVEPAAPEPVADVAPLAAVEPEAPLAAEPEATHEEPAPQPAPQETAVAPGLPGPEAFLDLDRPGRLALLLRLAGAALQRSHRAAVVDADHVFRVALGRARVTASARQKQRHALIQALSDGLRLDVATVTALIDDPSGEPLVLLMKAIGLSEVEAQQVLLFANPVIAQAIESFVRLNGLIADMDRAAADRLIQAWQTDRPVAKPAHQPQFADLELRRGTHPTAQPAAKVEDSGERTVFGRRGA